MIDQLLRAQAAAEPAPYDWCYVNGQQGAPLVYEDHPTHQNLVGRIEHIARFGTLATDFNLIVPGALHRANGGYLVLDAQRLLGANFGWESLKRVLRAGEIRTVSLEQLLSLASTVSLDPEPIPIEVKVILVGTPLLYHLLLQLDPDFPELFKIAADFDHRIDRSAATTGLYARLVASALRRERLRPLDRAAVARTIEEAARMSGDAAKLTAEIRGLVDLLQEADYLAELTGKNVVGATEIEGAIDARRHRAKLPLAVPSTPRACSSCRVFLAVALGARGLFRSPPAWCSSSLTGLSKGIVLPRPSSSPCFPPCPRCPSVRPWR
jgi:predicted ATP-dependent protease